MEVGIKGMFSQCFS